MMSHMRNIPYLLKVDRVLSKVSLLRWWLFLRRQHSSRVTDMAVLSLPLLQDVRRPP